MNPQPDARIRSLAIILVAMILGMLAFGCVSLAIKGGGTWTPNQSFDSILLLQILVGMIIVETPVVWLVRKIQTKQLRSRLESLSQDERNALLSNGFFAAVLIPAALLEGFGLFGVMIHQITGCLLGLIAPAIAAIGIAFLLPSRDKYERFAERMHERDVL